VSSWNKPSEIQLRVAEESPLRLFELEFIKFQLELGLR
jgi:hypothetical protein